MYDYIQNIVPNYTNNFSITMNVSRNLKYQPFDMCFSAVLRTGITSTFKTKNGDWLKKDIEDIIYMFFSIKRKEVAMKRENQIKRRKSRKYIET